MILLCVQELSILHGLYFLPILITLQTQYNASLNHLRNETSIRCSWINLLSLPKRLCFWCGLFACQLECLHEKLYSTYVNIFTWLTNKWSVFRRDTHLDLNSIIFVCKLYHMVSRTWVKYLWFYPHTLTSNRRGLQSL